MTLEHIQEYKQNIYYSGSWGFLINLSNFTISTFSYTQYYIY